MNIGHSILCPPGGKTQTDVWGTPRDLFDKLNAEFGFDLDPCTDGTNSMCRDFYTPDDDGLAQDWTGRTVFMNPPYKECLAWMRKAFESSQRGCTVVCLIPVRTDTTWWHEYAMKGEVRFIRGRLRFGSAKANAPFPSAIVVFRNPWGGIA